jgi:succinate dehydrogenase / fumarate reductase cytochrome b subunit
MTSATKKRLFSLFGVFPLSIYVIVHLYNNLSSLQGPEAFNAVYERGRAMPIIVPIMIMVIWIPIFFHGIYGLFVAKQASKANIGDSPFFGYIKYILQRASGLGLLLFIPAHLIKAKIIPTFIEGHPADFAHMAEAFSEPLTLAVYCLGILGVAYHMANGLWQFCIGWGITTTEKAMQRMQLVSFLVFGIVASMGLAAIGGFFMSH